MYGVCTQVPVLPASLRSGNGYNPIYRAAFSHQVCLIPRLLPSRLLPSRLLPSSFVQNKLEGRSMG